VTPTTPNPSSPKKSAKSILEADGKASLFFPDDEDIDDVLDQAEVKYPWLLASGARFVAKPDQLIKRRGKSGLLALNKTWPEAKAWVAARARKVQKVESVEGILRTFLVEPFVPHPAETEYYICIQSVSMS
jgi:ATP citrate (pro-S)-lyase